MQIGPLILYSALIGALTGALVGGVAWLIRNSQALFMGEVLGFLPPGLASEGGLMQVFRGPNHWLFALLIPVVFALSSYIGLSHGIAWLLENYRTNTSIRFTEYLRMLGGSFIQLSAGSPLGREGPMATLGHWLGSLVGKRLDLGGTGRFLPFAGLAAGFAAAFHAPVAGALLASEILFRGLAFEIFALAPALIGALAGYTVYGAIVGYSTLLEVPPTALSWNALPFGVLIGLLAAGVGTLWLESSTRLGAWLLRWPAWLRHGLLGLALAMVLLTAPSALGDGLPWVQLGLSPIVSLPFLAIVFMVRFALVILAGAVRAFGGYITPALVLGGLLGLLLAQGIPGFAPPPAAAALAGMSAMLAGVARAPFAALVLAGEIASYSVLPLVLPAVFVAYVFTSAQTYPEELPDALPTPPAKPDANTAEVTVTLPESALQTEPQPPSPAGPDSPEKSAV